jgi:hypothetical protein
VPLTLYLSREYVYALSLPSMSLSQFLLPALSVVSLHARALHVPVVAFGIEWCFNSSRRRRQRRRTLGAREPGSRHFLLLDLEGGLVI